MNTSSSPPLKLPKLREGITIAFNDYDLEGKPQWLIHDAGRNKFFVIGWVEYELLNRWDISDPVELLETVNAQTTLHVDMSDLENLLKFLVHNYLIQQSGQKIYQSAKEQKIFKDENVLHWLISYYLFFRIPLFHPDNFLNKTKKIADWVFSRYAFYIMAFLGIIALYQLSMQWSQFTHTFSNIFTWQGLLFSLIAFVLGKLCHELGHAYMCKQYGVPVPTLGVAFLVFWPVLYTDTTLSWRLNSQQRLRITVAGIWVETYLTIFAALIWCNTTNLTLQSICYVMITVNWLGSVLMNVSPFMRFDGYYALADFLKMPNLQFRAFALTRWQIRRWLFDWPDPPPEKFSKRLHYILVTYSIITWIYRLTLYLGIAALVYHFVIKIVGIMLFIIEIFYFIVGPLVEEIKTWILFKEKFTFNIHTKITLITVSCLLLMFFIPISESVKLPATLSYTHEYLFAPEESVIQTNLPAIGSPVKAHQPIIQLYSHELTHKLEQLQLEYQKKLAELRRTSIDPKYAHQKNIVLSDINKQQAEYQKLFKQYSKLTLTVPFNGIIKEISPELHKGTTVAKDEWIADVIEPNTTSIEGYVNQINANLVRTGQRGHFFPHDFSEATIPVTVKIIEPLNAKQLTCRYSTGLKVDKMALMAVETPCFHANDLGGDIASYQTDEGDYVPIDSIYRVILTPNMPVTLNNIERGYVILTAARRSYAYRFFYMLKTLWIEQSGF